MQFKFEILSQLFNIKVLAFVVPLIYSTFGIEGLNVKLQVGLASDEFWLNSFP